MGDSFKIAIDGPAGAGKSTVAKMAAERLGYLYIDTGAMYRAVTLLALARDIDMNDSVSLTRLAKDMDLVMDIDEQGKTRVILEGADVSEQIRSAPVSRFVAQVSQIPGVRRNLAALQRQMGAAGNVIMEGRDIAANVLPEARLKIFLTASVETRARRRYTELFQPGSGLTYEAVLEDIISRDYKDTNRTENPLKPASDAEIIDSTDMTVEQVVELITSWTTEGDL